MRVNGLTRQRKHNRRNHGSQWQRAANAEPRAIVMEMRDPRVRIGVGADRDDLECVALRVDQ